MFPHHIKQPCVLIPTGTKIPASEALSLGHRRRGSSNGVANQERRKRRKMYTPNSSFSATYSGSAGSTFQRPLKSLQQQRSSVCLKNVVKLEAKKTSKSCIPRGSCALSPFCTDSGMEVYWRLKGEFMADRKVYYSQEEEFLDTTGVITKAGAGLNSQEVYVWLIHHIYREQSLFFMQGMKQAHC